MIPKIIHLIWLGEKNIPEEYKKNIEILKKINNDYHIKVWGNKDIHEFEDDFYRLINKPAFQSDYLRLKILYKYGGFYCDTDVVCYKKFDDFLDNDFVLGYHYDCLLGTAVIGSSVNNIVCDDLINMMIKYYNENNKFVENNYLFTDYFISKYDLVLNGKNCCLNDSISIYNKYYFEQPSLMKKKNYTFHTCGGSWYKKNKSIFKRFFPIYLKRLLSESINKKKKPFYKYYLSCKRNKKCEKKFIY